jgi:hypothetical protein
MIRYLLAGAALALAMPALAQDTYRTRTVLVYGDDPCPKSENPDEIIVCARRPEEERYRIPKELREQEKAATIAKEDNVPATRAALVTRSGAGNVPGSCTPSGPGGFNGCNQGVDIVQAVRTVKDAAARALEPDDK